MLKRLVAVPLLFALATGAAWAYWSAGSVPGGNGASAATSLNPGATPAASAAGDAVTVSWAASTFSDGSAVDGYELRRYDLATLTAQPMLSCEGQRTHAARTCTETDVPPGQWVYTVQSDTGTYWLSAESPTSNAVTVNETTPPANAISLSGVSGNAVQSGNTVYYRGAASGSFTLANAVSDSGSGPASSATATLTGTATGWTHSPSTISTPSGGPYVSSPFSWSAGATSAPTEVVTGRDVAGNTADTTLSFVNDSTAPTAGTVTYPTGYQAGRSVDVTFTAGTDSGSGLGDRQLQRSSAPLTAGTCGTYSSFANLGQPNRTSPYTDSQVTNGVCYQYRYIVFDLVGNQDIATSTNVVMVDYAGAVNATTGLLSQWRLGESASSSDSFTGGSGSLTLHTGEIGATWVHEAGGSSTRISNANRVRKSFTAGYSIDNTTATPPSPDYSVVADLYVASNLAGDTAGVIGRLNTSNTSFYMARWEQANTSWNLIYYAGGMPTSLASVTGQPALTVGATYRVRLSMVGTELKLYVNGVPTLSTTHSTLTAVGKAGIMHGADNSSPAGSDTTGIHFDNFQVTPRAADSKGSNPGDYFNGVTLSATGALAADANTAAAFDGTNDYVQAVGTTGIPVGASLRSVEMWFKTSSAARQVLFAYGALADTQEFGLWLDAGGASMTAWGSGSGNDKTFTLASAVNNGAWHQVVKAYDGTNITLYIDGVALTPQAATRATVMDSYGFGIGAIINPGDANSGGYFNGSLDEVSFYTTALDQATVTNHYQLGTSPAPDITGPTGGSVAASGLVGTGSLYSTSAVLTLNLADGTDPSGLSGDQLLRATAPLTSSGGTANGSCGTYGSYTLVTGGTDPPHTTSDTVADQACYRYQYVVADTLGNSTTYQGADIKVDLTAPAAPSLTFGTFTNTYWNAGSTVFYRSAAASGSFRATASATDAKSGIASYGFPALGTNWTSTPVSLGVNTYAWTVTPAASGTSSVTATNNATGTSAGTPFTLTADDTAPTAGTVTYPDGVTGPSVSVSFTTGTDSGSGLGARLLQRATATLTGSTCGTFGAFSTRSTNPATSPYVDTISTTDCYKYQYVVPDNVGNQDTATSTNVVKADVTGPTGGSVAASGLVGTGPLYAASTTVSLDLVQGTDPNGIATTGNQLQRATGTLSNGSCSAYGSYTLVTGGTDPASPKSDTVADQACYKYQYVVADTLGNSTTYQGADIKVDLTAPAAPSLTFSNFSGNNTYWSGSGSTVFYRSAAASGSFRATASASDTRSGIASYAFPDLGTNWTSTPVSLGVNTYAWTVTPAASGTSSVTATNNATGTSAGTPFTLTADDTAPTAGTVTYLNGAQSSTSVSVSFTSGTDTGGSGIATATRVLQRASATLTSGTCGSFGSFATRSTNPTSPYSDSVTTGNCYKYQYVVLDNVGNQDTATSASVVKISSDVTGPTGGSVAASGLVGTGSLYSTSTTLSLNLATGTDPSGVATTGNLLQRATATLTSSGGTANGTCGSYGSYSLITGGTDPASPKSDTVADQACYRYRYVVADTLGNPTTYTSADIKVDTTAPAEPSLTFGTFTNTYWSGAGSTVFYRSAAASGSFTATASSTDTASGIVSYGFPALGTNWTSTPGSLGVNTYSWTVSPAASGTNSATATNNATGTSAGTSFTLTADDTAPSAGTVSYLDGATSSTSVSVSFTTGTDSGSGLGTRLLQRASAPLTGGTCGSYGSFATVTNGTDPTSPLVDTISTTACYKYQYVVPDNVGNQDTATSTNVVKADLTYLDTINGTAGLLSYWRLGDSGTASDTFTDTAGVTLQSHTAEIGSPWTKHAASTTDAVITNSNRIRKNGSSTLGALYYSSAVPASADYTVEADAYRSTNGVTNDVIGIVGRLDTTNALGTYYGAVYDRTAGNWVLYSMNNGVKASLGSYSATFSGGSTYRLSLDMNGSTIRLLVDGTQRVSVTNTTVTAAGRAGVTMGFGASNTTVDNTNGMHLDNFTVTPSLADNWGTNTGDYFNVPTLGVAGAITGDSNTAATFDGVNDYGNVLRQISNDFSIELWFKSTQGIGTGTQWWNGAGLVDAEVSGAVNDFGVSLRSDGKVVAGTGGGSDTSIVSTAGAYNNGAWHHVVFTRTMSSGALRLYVDGVLAGSATGDTTSLTTPASINFGRIQTGGNYFLGSLDEVAVYNTVLSAATVTTHYNAAQ